MRCATGSRRRPWSVSETLRVLRSNNDDRTFHSSCSIRLVTTDGETCIFRDAAEKLPRCTTSRNVLKLVTMSICTSPIALHEVSHMRLSFGKTENCCLKIGYSPSRRSQL